MGYTTDFTGQFDLNERLTPEHQTYLMAFANTRRMKRDANIASLLPDPFRIAVGLPIGPNGAYFVGGLGFKGQIDDPSVLEHNDPDRSQPGLWCQWIPSDDGTGIEWNGNEKFYNYVEWLKYLIANFIKPWGYVLSGEVEWQGEDSSDFGKIVVKHNVISTLKGRKVYE